jgi:hypothetical protein
MTDAYNDRLADLRREIESGGARPLVIDTAVAELAQEADPRLSADLLSLLSDAVADDDGMWTLVHTAESVSDKAYVAALLGVFPRLVEQAPRWTSIVLMRVLNSATSQEEMVRQLQSAQAPTKDAVRTTCERINAVSPEFLAKTIPVTLAAS